MDVMVKYAQGELKLLRSGDEPDEMQDMIEKHVLEIVQLFSNAGHSGSSASYTVNILDKVLRFEPVTPLTGADDEWNEISNEDDMRYQNKRCSHVFKRTDGSAYDSEGIIFRDPSGSCFTAKDSRVNVTFPYRPERIYVDVDENDNVVASAAVQLNVMRDDVHARNVAAGWWSNLTTGERIERNDGEMIALMHSELSEALEGVRKSKRDDHLPHRPSVEVEMADTVIRILDYCGGRGLDIGGAVVEKLAYNAKRQDHKRENRLQEGGKKI